MDRSVTATTEVSSVATLLAGVGSAPTPGIDTLAVFDSVPAKVGSMLPSTMNVAVAPLCRSTVVAMFPVPLVVSHVAKPDAVHVHETEESCAGITSLTGASETVDGPLFGTTIE